MITFEILLLNLIDIENKINAELNRASPTQIELQLEKDKFEERYKKLNDQYINS